MNTSLKSTGIVRKVDELGRIVIPKELRKVFDIKEKDALEIFTSNDAIVLKKYAPFCTFCGASDNLVKFSGKSVCTHCISNLKKEVK